MNTVKWFDSIARTSLGKSLSNLSDPYSLWETLLDLVYPPVCPACQNPSFSKHIPLCLPCLFTISPFSSQLTLPQQKPLLPSAYARIPYASLGKHTGPLRRLIAAIKQGANIHLARFLGRILAKALPRELTAADLIACVPSSKESLLKRGFNPAAVLAECIGNELHIPVDLSLISIKRKMKKQALLSRNKRIENVSDAYEISKNLQNTKILFVDDVLTTGATTGECIKKIFSAGGKLSGAVFFSFRPTFCH